MIILKKTNYNTQSSFNPILKDNFFCYPPNQEKIVRSIIISRKTVRTSFKSIHGFRQDDHNVLGNAGENSQADKMEPTIEHSASS